MNIKPRIINRDIIQFSCGKKKREELCGSLGSKLGVAFFDIANLSDSYMSSNICGENRKPYCKTANIAPRDLFAFYQYTEHPEDERVMIKEDLTGPSKSKNKKNWKFIWVKPITETDEEILNILITWLTNKFQDELTEGEFNYSNTSCDRKYHPLQNMPSTVRNGVFKSKGYDGKFDVKSCLPTTMGQVAGEEWDVNTVDYIAEQLGVERKLAKLAVNSSFYGATLTAFSSVLRLLDFNDACTVQLIRVSPIFMNTKKKINRIRKATGLDKDFNAYFRVERQIIECIEAYIKAKGGRVFTIHDGGYCDIELDRADLEEHVFNQTGFRLQIEVSPNDY
jgi:hypothetical protein